MLDFDRQSRCKLLQFSFLLPAVSIAKKKNTFRPTPTQVSEPVFNPGGGTFAGRSVSVTITCATSGASIRYKIGGTPPTSTSGTLIASGGHVNVSLNANGTLLQAIAYKSGLANSPVHADYYFKQGVVQQVVHGQLMTLAMPPSRNETFVYDQLGNRKGANTLDARGSVTFARRDTGLNQYASWTPPMAATNYDTNGVLTSEGSLAGTYNALNQPITISSSATSMTFGYDPLGRCVKRTTSTSTTYLYYDGWNLIQEGSNPSLPDRIYIHGTRVDEVVADQAAGGVWSYHHYDARGHCILLTDASGNLLEQYSYDAFGKIYYYDGAGNALSDTARGNRFLFTGREWLSTLRLYDYRNRLYLPELGRFIQPDPQEFAAGDYNLYRYCHNDPVNKSDPMGLIDGTVDRSGYREYQLARDTKIDYGGDGRHVEGVRGTENKPGDTVHLEVDRNVVRSPGTDASTTTHQTTAGVVDGTPTIHEQINVRLASDAGPKWQKFTRDNEWTHSDDHIKAANAYRASAAAWAAANNLSSSDTLGMLQRGATSHGSRVLDSVSEFNRRSFQRSMEKWDWTPLKGIDNTGGWRAPNGSYVWPHTPIDPETGNPLKFNE